MAFQDDITKCHAVQGTGRVAGFWILDGSCAYLKSLKKGLQNSFPMVVCIVQSSIECFFRPSEAGADRQCPRR